MVSFIQVKGELGPHEHDLGFCHVYDQQHIPEVEGQSIQKKTPYRVVEIDHYWAPLNWEELER